MTIPAAVSVAARIAVVIAACRSREIFRLPYFTAYCAVSAIARVFIDRSNLLNDALFNGALILLKALAVAEVASYITTRWSPEQRRWLAAFVAMLAISCMFVMVRYESKPELSWRIFLQVKQWLDTALAVVMTGVVGYVLWIREEKTDPAMRGHTILLMAWFWVLTGLRSIPQVSIEEWRLLDSAAKWRAYRWKMGLRTTSDIVAAAFCAAWICLFWASSRRDARKRGLDRVLVTGDQTPGSEISGVCASPSKSSSSASGASSS